MRVSRLRVSGDKSRESCEMGVFRIDTLTSVIT